jgi:hypothetical protein
MSSFKSRFSTNGNFQIVRVKRKDRRSALALMPATMIERLETRLLLSTVNWIGGVGD